MSDTLRRYLLSNKITSLVGGYLFLSAVTFAMTGIDICIPCVWRTMFGFKCPGCGLTTAFTELLKLNFNGAIKANWMIFPMLPIAVYLIKSDFDKFKKQ